LNEHQVQLKHTIRQMEADYATLSSHSTAQDERCAMLTTQIDKLKKYCPVAESIDRLSLSELQQSYASLLQKYKTLLKEHELLKLRRPVTKAKKKDITKTPPKSKTISYLKECLAFKDNQLDMLQTQTRIVQLQMQKLQQENVLLNEQLTLRTLPRYKRKRIKS